ncbi:MAG TPA: lipid-transfer protein, partial [Candidatus Eisenbacteria bacterium]|nr:lipid-transfer protein [Candidatus Eisenbacteria bacterium]
MRDVAVVAFAQAPSVRREERRNEVEMLMPVVREALGACGLTRRDIGFFVSGSSDYLAGAPFSFVHALDAIGAWPPIQESHVEMDGAWALYEAWVRLQHGDVDTALVYAFGKSSPGRLRELLALQLDPYLLAPLWPDAVSLAALQARLLLDSGQATEADLAEVVCRSRRAARSNPDAQLRGEPSVEALLAEPYLVSPLRRHDCPPISDGAAVAVLAAGRRARELCERPAWIAGIDHRVDAHALGVRELTASPSTALAAERAGAREEPADLAELHAPFSHQEL